MRRAPLKQMPRPLSLCIRLVAIPTKNVPGKDLIVFGIKLLELASIGGDETDKWIPDKHEFGVLLQLCL